MYTRIRMIINMAASINTGLVDDSATCVTSADDANITSTLIQALLEIKVRFFHSKLISR